MINIMDQWKRGEEPKKGPQINRQHSCGPEGRTSLYPEQYNVEQSHTRDFAAAKKDWEEARAKAAAAAAAAKKQ
jgi:hypothetical protein